MEISLEAGSVRHHIVLGKKDCIFPKSAFIAA